MKIESPAKIKPIAPIAIFVVYVSCCTIALLMMLKTIIMSGRVLVFFKLSNNQLASYTDTSGLIILSSMFVGAEASWDESKEYL